MTITKDQLWERVKQIEEIKAMLTPIADNVEKTSIIVTGNGEPERGLATRFSLLEQSVNIHHDTPHISKDELRETVIEACNSKPKDNGDERRKNAFQRMTPKNKILIGIAITGFIFTYAVQIYSVAKAIFSTLVSQ